MLTKPNSLLSGLGLLAVILVNGNQEPEQIQEDTTPFMIVKLDHSREIVAGLALGDFSRISKNAQDLMVLSHEADWNVESTPAYLKMSSEFRGSAGRLRDAATDKNLDGSTLAYFEVTLNCVRCHKYIRDDPGSRGK